MRLILTPRNGRQDAEKTSSRDRRPSKLPERIPGPDDIEKPRDTPQPDVIPYSSIPCPFCFPVVTDRRGILSPRVYPFCIRRFYRDSLWRTIYVVMRRYTYTRRIKCKRLARDWPWEVPSFIRQTLSARASSKIYMDLPSISCKRA